MISMTDLKKYVLDDFSYYIELNLGEFIKYFVITFKLQLPEVYHNCSQ